MIIEVYCDKHSIKIEEVECDHSKPSPIYVTPCEQCIREAMQEGREEIVRMMEKVRVK